MTNLTQDRLKEVVDYNPCTGGFTRKITQGGMSVGSPSGAQHHTGYILISIDGKRYAAHRLAWLYINGEWPNGQVDHINRIKNDNRVSNLRESTRSQNYANSPKKVTNKSGYKGVFWNKVSQKWVSEISVNKVRYFLGYFKNKNEAALAYNGKAKELLGEFAFINNVAG